MLKTTADSPKGNSHYSYCGVVERNVIKLYFTLFTFV